jgi:CRISPR-associated protein Cmr5
MQTRDQRYAVDAYNNVFAAKQNGKNFYEKYGSMAHKLPILIRTAGLAQALSFVEAKASDNIALKRLLVDIGKTVSANAPLSEKARGANLIEYILLTKQVMDALLWYKRFAQSVLGVQANDEEIKL